MDYLPYECDSLDSMLGGGLELGCITLFYGEAGSGKTNLCLILARNMVQSGKKVIYIDTEGVSLERLSQICGDGFDSVSKNILFSEVHSFKDQETMVDKAIKLTEGNPDIGMIIVDSMTMYYRLLDKEEERTERKSMANQSAKLLSLARRRGLPVVITSQVFMDIDKGVIEALGGNVLHHNAKTIVKLERSGIGRRKVTVMKHRHIAEGKSAEIQLTQAGIDC